MHEGPRKSSKTSHTHLRRSLNSHHRTPPGTRACARGRSDSNTDRPVQYRIRVHGTTAPRVAFEPPYYSGYSDTQGTNSRTRSTRDRANGTKGTERKGQRETKMYPPRHTHTAVIRNNCSLELELFLCIVGIELLVRVKDCLLYTSPSPRDRQKSRMPSSA